jgi:hypothetical protein
LGAVVLVVLLLPLSSCVRTAATSVPSYNRPLATRGSLLVDPSGHRVVLRGVTVYALPFYDDDGGRADPYLAATTTLIFRQRASVFAAIAAAGANVVRIPVSASSWAHDAYGIGGQQGYLARLQAIVEAAQQAGLRVIVAWWDASSVGSHLEADEPQSFPMMRSVEHAFRNDGGVAFEPLNEPHDVSWAAWQRVVDSDLQFWRHDLGYRGLLIVDTIDFSWSFDPAVATEVLATDGRLRGTGPDLVFANHRYANANPCFCGTEAAAWEAEVGRYVGTFPILGDEYGNFNAPYAPQPAWTAQFLAVVGSQAINRGMAGALAFVWNWVDPNSMTGHDAITLNSYGQEVERELLKHT